MKILKKVKDFMATNINYKPGDIIFRKNQETIQFIQLLDGEIAYKDGKKLIHRDNRAGSIHGLQQAMEKTPIPYDIIALSQVKTKFIDSHPIKLKEDLINDPYLGLEITSGLAIEIYKYKGRIEYLEKIMHELHNYLHVKYLDYYNLCEVINEDYKKKRIPWLSDIYEDIVHCLAYKYGKINKENRVPQSEPITYTVKLEESVIADKTFETFEQVKFNAGENITKEGQIADELFILLEGKVDLYHENRRYMSLTGKGACIGELEILQKFRTLDKITRKTTYTTATVCKLIQIPAPRILNVFKAIPELGYYLFHLIKYEYPMVQEEYRRQTSIIEKDIDSLGENMTENLIGTFKEFQKKVSKLAEDEKVVEIYIENAKNLQMDIKSQLREYKKAYKIITDLSLDFNQIDNALNDLNNEKLDDNFSDDDFDDSFLNE